MNKEKVQANILFYLQNKAVYKPKNIDTLLLTRYLKISDPPNLSSVLTIINFKKLSLEKLYMNKLIEYVMSEIQTIEDFSKKYVLLKIMPKFTKMLDCWNKMDQPIS